ncbi:hypothetical protein [Brevibacillus borstelensis]|uniref:hypothetical protein n=1 Tax=Brevibacillus borstelensis TaxID=45462 RepID=UPI0030BC9F15
MSAHEQVPFQKPVNEIEKGSGAPKIFLFVDGTPCGMKVAFVFDITFDDNPDWREKITRVFHKTQNRVIWSGDVTTSKSGKITIFYSRLKIDLVSNGAMFRRSKWKRSMITCNNFTVSCVILL